MTLTYRRVITRALVVGLVAGVLVALYTFTVVEPTIEQAIALEEAGADAHAMTHDDHHAPAPVDDDAAHHHGDDAIFSRPVQVLGGMAAIIVYGVIVAAIFATVFARVRHRLPGRSELVRAVWLAAIGFGTVALIPALKYPANPPGVGDPSTVNQRTIQYAALLATSIALAVVLVRLAAWLRGRVDRASRAVIIAAATVVGYGLLLAALPGTPDAIDPGIPSQLVWEFRVGSLGSLALLWSALGFGLGWALERACTRDAQSATTVERSERAVNPV